MVSQTSEKELQFVEDNYDEFRQRFIALYKRKGESIRYMADFVGISPTTLMAFIKGKWKRCHPRTLVCIEKYLQKHEHEYEGIK